MSWRRRIPVRLVAALDAITAGLCPTCKEPIEVETDLNGIIVAIPCRHVLRGRKEPPHA